MIDLAPPRDLRHTKLLTAAEEHELAGLIAVGRRARRQLVRGKDTPALRRATEEGSLARDKLVLHNQGLVYKIARKYRHHGVEFEDLIQEGQLALIRAAEIYNPERGTRFCTPAIWWIRASLNRMVSLTGRTIRIPDHAHTRRNLVLRTETELCQRLGRMPTTDEIASHLGLHNSQVELLLTAFSPTESLDAELAGSDDGRTLMDRMAAPDVPIEEQLEEKAIVEAVRDAVCELTPAQQRLVIRRHGLCGHEPAIFAEMTHAMPRNKGRRITRQGVFHRYQVGMRALKRNLTAMGFNPKRRTSWTRTP